MLPSLKSDLVVTSVLEEILVYDPESDKAHCLSNVGKAVYLACSAKTSRAELVDTLAKMGVADPQGAIEESLNQFSEESLLVATTDSNFDRRRFLAAAGSLAAVPVLVSVFAPAPSQAASCFDCPIDGLGVPTDCTKCGGNCPSVGCDGDSICCFEYVVAAVLNPTPPPTLIPTFPSGTACSTFRTSDIVGNTYLCRSGLDRVGYTKNNTFRTSCQAARDAVLAGPGTHTNERYYCCNCDNTNAFYSCNVP